MSVAATDLGGISPTTQGAARQWPVALRHTVLLLLLAALLLSRCPGAVLHPTLWAEDGKLWFEDAYNFGLASLGSPHTGYLQSYPRLVALAGRLLPLRLLPAWFVAAGLAMQIAPVALMLNRGEAIIPSPPARWALILFYLGMPNSEELYLHLTDAQWHFGLVLFLLAMMPTPRQFVGRLIQYTILLVGGLSGPFSVLIAPLAWWHAAEQPRTHRRQAIIQASLLSLAAAIQTAVFAWGAPSARFRSALGASPVRFARVVTDQIFAGGMIGTRLVRALQSTAWWHNAAVPWLLTIWGLGAMALAFRHGSSVFRKFAVLATLVLGCGLISPVISIDQPQWLVMDIPGVGCRYYFFPILAWFAAVLLLCGHSNIIVRGFARALLACFLIGVAFDWRYDLAPSDVAARYHQATKMYRRAPPGTMVLFPADPADIWAMRLVKR